MLVHRGSALALRRGRFRSTEHTCACPSARRPSSLPNECSSALHSLQARQHSMKRAASAPGGAPTCSGSGITDAETLVRRNHTLVPRSAALVPSGRRARAPRRRGELGALHAHEDASDTGGRMEITLWGRHAHSMSLHTRCHCGGKRRRQTLSPKLPLLALPSHCHCAA